MANALQSISSPQLPLIVKHLKIFRWGCTPFEFQANSRYRISTSLFIVSILLVIIDLFGFIYTFWNAKPIGPFTDAVRLAKCVNLCVHLPLHLFWMLWNRFKCGKTIKRLIALQRILGTTDYKMFNAVKVYILSVLSLLGIFMLSRPIYHNITNPKENSRTSGFGILRWAAVLSLVMSVICRLLAVCFFTYLVCCVRACFSELATTVFVGKTDVKRFVRIYSHLADVSSEISEYFDPNASATLLYCFLYLVEVTSTAMSSQYFALNEKMHQMLGLLLTGTSVVHIIHVCHNATEEADSCSKVLTNHFFYDQYNSNYNDPYAILHVCIKKTAVFKICKSLTINYNLGIKMIAAYLTYTIVLFQVDISTPTPSPSTNSTQPTPME